MHCITELLVSAFCVFPTINVLNAYKKFFFSSALHISAYFENSILKKVSAIVATCSREFGGGAVVDVNVVAAVERFSSPFSSEFPFGICARFDNLCSL